MSRFRPAYRKLSPDEQALSDAIKDKAAELEALYEKVQGATESRHKSLAMTTLEESVMWIVKDLTGAPRVDEQGNRRAVLMLGVEEAEHQRRVRAGYVKE